MDKKPSHAQGKKAEYARIVSTAALAAGDGGDLPSRMKILKWGENPNSQGKRVNVGRKLVHAMSSPTYPFREVALDYEHNTCPGTPEYERSQEPRPVAAFLSVEVVEGEGVFVNVGRWTPDGEKNARHYCDLSAVPLMDAEGNVVSIISVALSRAGAVPDITFSQAALAAMGTDNTYLGEPEMTHKEMLIGLLELEADASDEAIQAAYDAKLEKAKQEATEAAEAAVDAAAAEAALETAKENAGETEAAALTAVATLAAQIQQVNARMDTQEKKRLIAAAAAEGKVVALSDDLIARLSVDDVQKHCAALPKMVPLAAITPVKIDEGKAVGLTETELEVAAKLGLTPEEYAKEKGAR